MYWPKQFKYPWRFFQTKFITATEIKLINARIEGPVNSHVRDEALLNDIVRSPIREEIREQQSDLNQLATIIASNLIKRPVFVGGNKRTALLAAGLFLLQNGMKLRATASQAVGNEALVEVHRGLSAGKIDEPEFSGVCRHLWRSTANSGATEPLSSQDRSEESIKKLMLSVSSKEEGCYRTTAILRSGSYKQRKDHQTVDCLIGDRSIFLENSVASRLTTSKPEAQSHSVTFQDHRVSGENRPGCYRLVFPEKRKVFNMLGLDGTRRMGLMFLDGPLDYSAINPSGTFGGESIARLEKM